MRLISLSLAILFVSSAQLRAQTADNLSADVLHGYFDMQLEMIKVTPGFTPPVASRSLSYAALTAYESVVNGSPSRLSMAGLLPQLDQMPAPSTLDLNWAEVANHALYMVVSDLYSNAPNDLMEALEDLRLGFTSEHSTQSDAAVMVLSADYGNEVGQAILAYAAQDGQPECQFSNFPADYVPPVGPGLWSPLSGQAALQPYWGDKRCFVVEFVPNDLISPAPPEFSTAVDSELYEEAMAVYETVNNVTEQETIIAQYWADGAGTVTPPGHSISMLKQVLEQEASALDFAAEAYARVGFAVADAFVQCWKTKYVFNLERPITYIQNYIDPEWETIVATPPFPEYTSGHSSQSGAWGVVMAELFGDEYTFTDNTHGTQFGGPRTFTSFSQCAEETAVSRLYGGIHYPIGNNMGSMSGQAIGHMVNMLFEQIVSVPLAERGNALTVYPNPTRGEVYLQGEFNRNERLVVYSLAGQQAMNVPASQVVDLSVIPAGMYLASIVSSDGAILATSRIVRQ